MDEMDKKSRAQEDQEDYPDLDSENTEKKPLDAEEDRMKTFPEISSVFTAWDFVFDVVAIVFFYFDLAAVILLVMSYFTEGLKDYSGLTMMCVIVPNALISVYSMIWYCSDDAIEPVSTVPPIVWKLRIIFHVLLMAPAWRAFESVYFGCISLKIFNCEKYNAYQSYSDMTISLLKLMQAYLGSFPQLVLQLSILAARAGNIEADPIFSDRASPIQAVGSKRFRGPPCAVEDLPKIDFVLISHNHYDHLDYNTVKKLTTRFGTQITWFVPLGLKKWMNDTGCENVYELNWWEKHKTTSNIEIIATPAQHWSKRSINDDNKAYNHSKRQENNLWSSWCVIGSSSRFYFAGDTGYPKENAIFKLIGDQYGPFDLAAIPIGAYEPRWFMQDQHVNPEEAVQIHLDVRARFSVGVHWGTFALANEHYLAPRKDLLIALKEQNIDWSNFFTLKHGESRVIPKQD
uniref:XK-related protein n=1 Tax=Strigamia maritima TaxID=126957 RepID=T1JL10_STRMM